MSRQHSYNATQGSSTPHVLLSKAIGSIHTDHDITATTTVLPAPSSRILRSCRRSMPREGAALQRIRLTFSVTADSARRWGSMEGPRSTWQGASLPVLLASQPTTPLGSQSAMYRQSEGDDGEILTAWGRQKGSKWLHN